MSKREFDDLGDLFTNVARRKHRAEMARGAGTSPDGEPSRDVYAESCARIAASFTKEDFKYAKSGPHFSRSAGVFRHRVVFQTSHHNIAGEHVALWVHANVLCPALKKWRSAQPHPCGDHEVLANAMVHLLQENHGVVEWELADSQARDDVIADVVATIRTIVLPYFDLFVDPHRTIAAAVRNEIRCINFGSLVEFILCFGNREDAQRVLDRSVAECPNLHEAIAKAEDELARKGFSARCSGAYPAQIAWLRKAYGLD